MQLYFNNGTRVSIQHPSYNDMMVVGEVELFTDDDIIVHTFHTAEDLVEILNTIRDEKS